MGLRNEKRQLYNTKTESETNSNKKKTCISSTSRRKLVHDPYISTKGYLRNIPEI